MALVCPNKASIQWQLMQKHVGERESYRAYMAHSYTLPNAMSSIKLMEQIGLNAGQDYLPEKILPIKAKLAAFNIDNGTSHGLNIISVKGSGAFKIKLTFNYLPLTKEYKQNRDNFRTNQAYDKVEDGESFSDIAGFPNTPEFDVFVTGEEDAAFEALMDTDDVAFESELENTPVEGQRKGPKFQPYADDKRHDLDRLYRDRGNLDKRMKSLNKREMDSVEKKKQKIKIAKKLNINKMRIKQLEDSIKDIEKYQSLNQIEFYAEKDMKTLEKIFAVKTPSLTNLSAASRLIDIWKRAGDFDPAKEHIFYDKEEFALRDETYEEMTTKFRDWAYRATLFEESLIEAQLMLMEGKIKETLGESTQVDLSKPLPDVGTLMRELLDVAEVNNVGLQALAAWIKDANWAAHKEGTEIFKKIDELLKKTKLRNYDIFRQNVANGDDRHTGEMVHRFSNAFFEWKDKLDRARNYKMENARRSISELYRRQQILKAHQSYFSNLSKGAITVDPNILFPDPQHSSKTSVTEKERDDHINELKELLGEKGYADAYADAERLIEEYKLHYESKELEIEAEVETLGELATSKYSMDDWVRANSPYLFSDVVKDDNHSVTYNKREAYPYAEFAVIIPKKNVDEGTFGKNFNGFYDEKFKRIEDNPAYLEFYDFALDLFKDMKAMLPNKKTHFMRMNSIPSINKETMRMVFKGGVQQGFSHISDAMKEYSRKGGITTIPTSDERREFQLRMLTDHRSQLEAYVQNKDDVYRAEFGIDPTPEMRNDWRHEAMDIISEEKSFDLGKIMKAFSQMAISYKHRASIEDPVRIMRQIIERGVEEKRDAAGDPVKDKHKNLMKNYYGLENITKMLDNFLDVVFWNYPSKHAEFKGKTKKYTSREEKAKKLIKDTRTSIKKLHDDKLITQLQYEGRMDALKEQEDALGGVRIYSNHADALLKYVQLKGMGWNGFAGFANLGFGVISNFVEASDGRNYSMRSMRKAYTLSLNSVGRNLTFNAWDGVGSSAKKIRELMDAFTVLKDSKHEIYKSTLGDNMFKRVGGKLDWANPYNIQTRTEYLNQAPVMIAMMMETKVKTESGKEISAWEAYDTDGKLKKGVIFPAREEFAMKRRIDKLVKMNHGNYDPDLPLRFKSKVAGRAVTQFRTWALQGFEERFGSEKRDEDLIDRIAEKTGTHDHTHVDRKGRYRSYLTAFQGAKVPVVGPLFNMTYQLLRKAAFQQTTFEKQVGGKFTDVDAANMRKNMTEIMIAIMIAGVALMIKAFAKSLDGEDDDDESKRVRFAAFFMINVLARLSTDIQFYGNPKEFERLARYAVPAFSVVADSFDALDSAWTIVKGGDDILQSGPSKGKSRLWRDTKKLLPLIAQYEKAKSAGRMVYKKD